MIPGDRACDPLEVGDLWRGSEEEKMTLWGRSKHQGLRENPQGSGVVKCELMSHTAEVGCRK